ncbi:unnamed protein product [Closterium sp. NIES-64]|nr:unnamed protein product [Closterium sp. NIES-64]
MEEESSRFRWQKVSHKWLCQRTLKRNHFTCAVTGRTLTSLRVIPHFYLSPMIPCPLPRIYFTIYFTCVCKAKSTQQSSLPWPPSLSALPPLTRIYFACVCKAVTGCTARKVEDRIAGPPRGKHSAPPAVVTFESTQKSKVEDRIAGPPRGKHSALTAAATASAAAASTADATYAADTADAADAADAAADDAAAPALEDERPTRPERMEMRKVIRMTTSGFHNHPSSLCLKRRRRADVRASAMAAPFQDAAAAYAAPLAALLKPHHVPSHHAATSQGAESPKNASWGELFATIPQFIPEVQTRGDNPKEILCTSKPLTDLIPSYRSLGDTKETCTALAPAVLSHRIAGTAQRRNFGSMHEQIMALSKETEEISQADDKLGFPIDGPWTAQRSSAATCAIGNLQRTSSYSHDGLPWPAGSSMSAPHLPAGPLWSAAGSGDASFFPRLSATTCATQGMLHWSSLGLPQRFPNQCSNPAGPAGPPGLAEPAENTEPAGLAPSAFLARPEAQTAAATSAVALPQDWQFPASAKVGESSSPDVALLLEELLTPAEWEVMLSRMVQKQGPLDKVVEQQMNASVVVASMDSNIAAAAAAAAAAAVSGGGVAAAVANAGMVLRALDSYRDLAFASTTQIRASPLPEPLPFPAAPAAAAAAAAAAQTGASSAAPSMIAPDSILAQSAPAVPNTMGATPLDPSAKIKTEHEELALAWPSYPVPTYAAPTYPAPTPYSPKRPGVSKITAGVT